MQAPVRLPRGTSVYDVADACRTALDGFLALDPQDLLALSRWFAGPYRDAVSFAGRRMASAGPGRPISYTPIPELVSSAQATVKAATAAAARPGGEDLVGMCPSVVDIVPTRDVLGAHGYAPLNQAHARLATRVFTILIADYLTRPDAYLGDAARSVTPRRQVFAASCPHALPAI